MSNTSVKCRLSVQCHNETSKQIQPKIYNRAETMELCPWIYVTLHQCPLKEFITIWGNKAIRFCLSMLFKAFWHSYSSFHFSLLIWPITRNSSSLFSILYNFIPLIWLESSSCVVGCFSHQNKASDNVNIFTFWWLKIWNIQKNL